MLDRVKASLKRSLHYIFKGIPVVNVQANIVQFQKNKLLADRVALITGGTAGIGYEIAKAFLMSGAKVIITGRDIDRLKCAAKKLQEDTENVNVAYYKLDNQNVESLKVGVKEVVSIYGFIDILVNNAGVLSVETISTENIDQYDKVMNTNLRGPFFLTQQIGKYMIDNNIKGNILNVGSSSCLRPAVSAYTLSKWGIRALTLGLARVLAPYGITVNGIAPGQTLTSMVPNKDSINNLYRPNIPLGRWIKPEEIANMALFLVSDMGKSIIGDIVYMTGGAAITTFEDMTYNF